MKGFLLALVFLLAAGVPAVAETLIRSHRQNPGGWSEHCPGSSTVLAQYVPGVGITELDIQISSDGTPWVIHDSTVDRTTSGSGTVASKTDAQMAALVIDETAFPDVGTYGVQHPQTLEATLNFWLPKRMRVLIETKASGQQTAIAKVLAKTGFPLNRVWILTDGIVYTTPQHRASAMRYCPIVKISSSNPIDAVGGLAPLKAEGWDGISWQAYSNTDAHGDAMEAAGLYIHAIDTRGYSNANLFAETKKRYVDWLLVDSASDYTIGIDDLAWSDWATTAGVSTSIANINTDTDGDGWTNFEECVFGTVATTPDSPPTGLGYSVRYSGSGTTRRADVTVRTKPGVVSWEFWWFQVQETTDGSTWTAVPTNRFTEDNSRWPKDPSWRFTVDLGSVASNTQVRAYPKIFPRP